MTDERNLQFNNLRKQIHQYQSREEELRKFLRVLNKDEDSIKADYLDHFNRIMDTFLPNG
tara:strand:- start:4598 stop:4777 length:180 start_codon:yes stop_codon:yes gene_type:complete